MTNSRYAAEILASSTKYGLDPFLVTAICSVESSFDPEALRYEPKFQRKYIDLHPLYSHLEDKTRYMLASSLGLMQVMGVVAHELGLPIDRLNEMFYPEMGLDYGCKKLKSLFDRYRASTLIDKTLILNVISAYNAGTVRWKNGKYVNQSYVDKVWKEYGR